jgi:hypothetical protein
VTVRQNPFVLSEGEGPAAPSAVEARLVDSSARDNRISTSLDAGGASTSLGTNGPF